MRARLRRKRLIRRFLIIAVVLLTVGVLYFRNNHTSIRAMPDGSEPPVPCENKPEVTETQAPPEPASDPYLPHIHKWQPVYSVDHTAAAGHYEEVVIEAAWDEPQYGTGFVCGVCGASFTDAGSAAAHLGEHDYEGSYYQSTVQTGSIHHDAVTQQKWVQDRAEQTEPVLIGYRCECGASMDLKAPDEPIGKSKFILDLPY